MATKKRIAKTASENSQTDQDVITFLSGLDHPLKKEIEAVRKIILGASPEIREGIKWNSPSFRTTEYFATLNLRGGRVWLILHLGAKVKDGTKAFRIEDQVGLLKWLSKDRAVVTFADAEEVKAKRAGLEAIVREWIKQV